MSINTYIIPFLPLEVQFLQSLKWDKLHKHEEYFMALKALIYRPLRRIRTDVAESLQRALEAGGSMTGFMLPY